MSCMKKTNSGSGKKENSELNSPDVPHNAEQLPRTYERIKPQHFNEDLSPSKLTYSAQYEAPNCQQCCNPAATNQQSIASTQCQAYCNAVPLYDTCSSPMEKKQQFIHSSCPCNNAPYKLPPCIPRDDLWDLQFCRWWGWNWIRRREEMLNEKKKSPEIDIITNKKPNKRKRAKGYNRGEFFRWCRKLFKNRHKPKSLKAEEKKQLRQLYATPCSSIVFNDVCSCPMNWECRSLNLEGQYECYSSSTRETSLSTVLIKNRTKHEACKRNKRKHQSWIFEKSDSGSSDDFCPCIYSCAQKADSSTEDSLEYLSQRIAQVRSGCECESGCSCLKVKPKEHSKNCPKVICSANKNKQKENLHIYCPYAVKLIYKKKVKHPKQKPRIHEESAQTIKLPSPSKNLPLRNALQPTKIPRFRNCVKCKCQPNDTRKNLLEVRKIQKREHKSDHCNSRKKACINCCSCQCRHPKKKILKLETPKMYCCHCCCCCTCKEKTQNSSCEELLRLLLKKNINCTNNESKNLTNTQDNNFISGCNKRCSSNSLFHDENVNRNFPGNSAQCRILKDFNEISTYKSPLTGKMYSVEPTVCTTKEIFYTSNLPKPLNVADKLLNFNICSSNDKEHSILLRAVCEAIMSSRCSNKEQTQPSYSLKTQISSHGDCMTNTNYFWAPKLYKSQKCFINNTKNEKANDDSYNRMLYSNSENVTCTKFTLPKTVYNSLNSYNSPNCYVCADEVSETARDSANSSDVDEIDFKTRTKIPHPHYQVISCTNKFYNNFVNKRRPDLPSGTSDIKQKTLNPLKKGNCNSNMQKQTNRNLFRSNNLDDNSYLVKEQFLTDKNDIRKKASLTDSSILRKGFLKKYFQEFRSKPRTNLSKSSNHAVKFFGMPFSKLFVSVNGLKIRSPELTNGEEKNNLKQLLGSTLHDVLCANPDYCEGCDNTPHSPSLSEPISYIESESLPSLQHEIDTNKIFQTKIHTEQPQKQLEYITFVNDDTLRVTSSRSENFELVKPRYITCPLFKTDKSSEVANKQAENLNICKTDKSSNSKIHKNENWKVRGNNADSNKSVTISKNKSEKQIGCQRLNESESIVQQGFRKGSHLTYYKDLTTGALPIDSFLNEPKEEHFTAINDYEREIHSHDLIESDFKKYANEVNGQQKSEVELNKHLNKDQNICKGQEQGLTESNSLYHLLDNNKSHSDNLKPVNCLETFVNQQKLEIEMEMQFKNYNNSEKYTDDIKNRLELMRNKPNCEKHFENKKCVDKELGYFNFNSSDSKHSTPFEVKQKNEHTNVGISDSERYLDQFSDAESETTISDKFHQQQEPNENISFKHNPTFAKKSPTGNIAGRFQRKNSNLPYYFQPNANDWPLQKQQTKSTESLSNIKNTNKTTEDGFKMQKHFDCTPLHCNGKAPLPPSQLTVSTSPLHFKHPSIQTYQTPMHAITSSFHTQYPTVSGRGKVMLKNRPYEVTTSSRESPFSMFCVPVANKNIRHPHNFPDDGTADLCRPERKIVVAKLKEKEKR